MPGLVHGRCVPTVRLDGAIRSSQQRTYPRVPFYEEIMQIEYTSRAEIMNVQVKVGIFDDLISSSRLASCDISK